MTQPALEKTASTSLPKQYGGQPSEYNVRLAGAAGSSHLHTHVA